MKKLLLTGAIALFGLSNAQIAKGTTYLSGSVGYSREESDIKDYKQENFNVLPRIGYFVNTNLAIGLGLGYETEKTTTETSDSHTLTNKLNKKHAFVVEPFVRKYWTLSDKLYIFGQLAVPMRFGKTKDRTSYARISGYTYTTSETIESKYTEIGVTVKPGLDYFLNKNWTIEVTIGEFGYNNFKRDDSDRIVHAGNFKQKDGYTKSNYNFGLNLASVTFGVKYVFAK
ncbi:porin family protein [Chryseobacterium arthrosphaerae]|uniref:Porin family protein n=1 Tax=Chryseobacterium arthrosphaerae TaxID=651561 RepID=A0A3S0Q4V3_9FLAO|nr:outer membrane beta-barrel protein [Chryseobacterium arthrosphaerae]AYZ12286.1 porin family protein [Chryseobacterium arthrosphaerae]RTZ46515.1 porin family protein [Chryseobacterium arthrosphaerae]